MMQVIPLPNHFIQGSGFFTVDRDVKMNYSAEFEESARIFQDFVMENVQIRLEKSQYANINFLLDLGLDNEGYRITITTEALTLYARTNHGAFYGIMTLMQLSKTENGTLRFPETEINDHPRFSHRGLLLDTARHFFSKTTVLHLIDLISTLKFNVFHLHLSDDQGWRMEIESYPKLYQIGSRRRGTMAGKQFVSYPSDNGYYTKQDLREIVAYAQSKYIEVIPEIDIPGHSEAMIAAYPILQCGDHVTEVKCSFGISPNILCAGNPKVYEILESVLREIMEIFPSRFIHLGGDEVPTEAWSHCPKCAAKMKEEHLHSVNELKTHFINHFCQFLRAHGKTAIVWNDCIHPQLDETAVIQHWKPFSRTKTAKEASRGRQVILSDFLRVYLDYPYTMTPLQKTYLYEPELKGADPSQIIGIEAALWTEWINDERKLEFQLFPRLVAVSETAWTMKQKKNYRGFLTRLQIFVSWLDQKGITRAKGKEQKPFILARIIKTIAWIRNKDWEWKKNNPSEK